MVVIYYASICPNHPSHPVRSSSRLNNPPINEVICGFVFDALPLTTLDMGVYWEQRRADFPRHELHPPLLDQATIHLGTVLDARVWLVGTDEQFLVQLQNDRFYVNWRRKGEEYPRFSSSEGRVGLKDRAIEEFRRFSRFAVSRTGHALTPTTLELTKIDVMDREIAYSDMQDLQSLVPVTQVFNAISLTDPQQLQLRLSEGEGETSTQIAVVMDTKRIRIETRHLFLHSGDMEADFIHANERVNEVFFGLVDTKRFGVEGP